MQRNSRNNRQWREHSSSRSRDSSRERSSIRERFSLASEGYRNIRVDYIARVDDVERRFRQALRSLEEEFGPINWTETKVIVPAQDLPRPAHCFLHFEDTTVHERVVNALNGVIFEGQRTRWTIAWYNPPFPRNNNVEARRASPPRSSITASDATAAAMPASSFAPPLDNRFKSFVRETVVHGIEQALRSQEQRVSTLVEESSTQAVQRAIAPFLTRLESLAPAVPAPPHIAAEDVPGVALCPVCFEALTNKDDTGIYSLACGHCICHDCLDGIRPAAPRLSQSVKCPSCRQQSEPRRLYFFRR